ncbi:pseudouridine synthase [Mesorhizobium xinjiangense]|uniref:pseudouridine synthase n=1 Tax=Mesorhizobium xinjiangense TaxID=2678685 RepID=UPI0012EE1690|nr:pseudouridine synthase [Mesorhizobium xinjiangense]
MNDKPDRPQRDGRPQRKGAGRPHADGGKPAQARGFGKRKFGAAGKADDNAERPSKPKWAGAGARAKDSFGGKRAEGDKRYAKPKGAAADRPRRSGPGEEGGEAASRKPRWAKGDDRAAERPGKRPERKFSDRPGKPGERRGKPGDRPQKSFASAPSERDRAKRPARRADETQSTAQSERIAKRLARAGVSSRREAEALIEAGRVSVNGAVLDTPARNVGPHDVILIDGTPIPAIERTRLFLFHKPAGVVTTNRDPEGRKTVFDTLPAELPRLMTIGRLDINTEGLLLLTNDGGLARVLELPSTGWLRRYRVRVHGKVDEARLAQLKDGVAVDGVFYGAIEATLDREQGSNAWLTIGLREGKNREVKNILASLGLNVTRLIRVSYGPFQLGELAEGTVQELKGRTLRDQLGDTLIEEAGANFDAPVVRPFSNKPVSGSSARPAERPHAPTRPPRLDEPGEGGLIKNRRRVREGRREDALDRLQTSKPKGGPPAKREDRPSRTRSANVWMAPGARPRGKAKVEGGQDGPAGGRGGGKPTGSKPTGGKPSGGGAKRPGKGRGHADRRR